MNHSNNSQSDSNDDSGFDISDFDDFDKQLDDSVNELVQDQQEKIPAKNLYIDLLEDFILTYSKSL